jgi:hypothetical protein
MKSSLLIFDSGINKSVSNITSKLGVFLIKAPEMYCAYLVLRSPFSCGVEKRYTQKNTSIKSPKNSKIVLIIS